MSDSWRLFMAFDIALTDPDQMCEVLDRLGTYGFMLDRIDDVEPVRRPYSRDVVAELFSQRSYRFPIVDLTGRGDHATVQALTSEADSGGSVNLVIVTARRSSREIVETMVRAASAFAVSAEVA
jgi:hypothetical protein